MLCLVDYRNLVGRSRVMRSRCIHGGVEYDASLRDACLSIISSPRASWAVFCLDGSPNYRLSIHPEYKGTRKKKEEDSDALPVYPVHLLVQDIRVTAQTFNTRVSFACSPFREADDVIASIVKGVSDNVSENLYLDERLSWWVDFGLSFGGWEKGVIQDVSDVCIMSSDSDLQQLLRVSPEQRVAVVSKMSLVDTVYEVSDTFKKKDVNSPAELLAYKIFEGDNGDNITRCRVVPPRKCGNTFWKTLNTESKLMSFVHTPDLFPELVGFVDIDRLRLNTRLVYLDVAAYPLASPYFLQL